MKRNQESIIGNSVALASALEQVSLLASINRPVLIVGERGTGKELAADRLHYLSPRWDAPLLKTNCAAIAEALLESELFGHEVGAFTGATRVQRGRFERADGGTLFLDELGTMSMRLQEKLLRLVEYGEFERLGGQQTLQVDVRVVAATNADLPALAAQGKFRADLLDRLSFDVVHLPPLRQRREDIAELAEHFAIQMSSELGWEYFPGFAGSAMQKLANHDWPGNIRELKNAVERSLHRWGDGTREVGEIVIDPFIKPWQEEAPPASIQADQASAPQAQTPAVTDFHAHMEALEKRLLQQALAENGGHQRRTAQALGLSYDQMRGMVRKHGLSRRRRG
ncbi:phage shock protein operon transcriptional activator [Pseudohalioglobus lutimaris]|uniref:Phage shock protein operon transcriptional activator n=1 Tax=Pseudohalioglobus lutimaris TaxID=1737061 RepID=A0A2N5WWT7_9GAMM|nr:phage shock protein operon transcriptional activator [Pseudohalioglobus lutimaris]PLW66704.1 phage shock protein operon transcriptional activator [Pseudohalioglobus lutimaris]